MTEPNEPNDSAVLSVLICTVHLTISYYHVTYSFKSESTLYSCRNVKDLLARNRRSIISLSGNNRIRTHNHLVYERILSNDFLYIQANIECRFTLKILCCMIVTYSQMHCTGKCSQHSSIIFSVW